MLFVQEQYQYLLSNFMCENYELYSFPNQELFLTLKSQVVGKKCTVVGSLTGSAEQALSLLLLLHTIKQHNPLQLTLFSPYLGYQRQDKYNKEGDSCGLVWADAMLHATGVQQVITLEAHNPQALSLLYVPVTSHTPELLFGDEMTYFVELGYGFVFPDQGVQSRYHWILAKFPAVAYGVFVKHRLHGMIVLQHFYGKLGRKVILYDDILDSGQTLVHVCIALRQMGVEEIVIFVTHAFFYGHIWNDLWQCGVKFLYCTNSLPAAQNLNSSNIRVKSIDFFLQNLL